MVFNGNTTGASYATTLLLNNTLIKLTGLTQANLRVKLVRPQIRRRVGINKIIIVENEVKTEQNKLRYDQVWTTVANSPQGPIMTDVQQLQWNENERSRDIIINLMNIPNDVLNYTRDLFAR
jgi:hypothetical protein